MSAFTELLARADAGAADAVGELMALFAPVLAQASRLVAKVDSAAVSDLESMPPQQWPELAQKDAQLHSSEAVRHLLSRAAASVRTMPDRAIGSSTPPPRRNGPWS